MNRTFITLLASLAFACSLYAQKPSLPEIYFPGGQCAGKECFDYWMNGETEKSRQCMEELNKICPGEDKPPDVKGGGIIEPGPKQDVLTITEVKRKTRVAEVKAGVSCNTYEIMIDLNCLDIYKVNISNNCNEVYRSSRIYFYGIKLDYTDYSPNPLFISVLRKQPNKAENSDFFKNYISEWGSEGDKLFGEKKDISDIVKPKGYEFSFLLPTNTGVYLAFHKDGNKLVKVKSIDPRWFNNQESDSHSIIVEFLRNLAIIASWDPDFDIIKGPVLPEKVRAVVKAKINGNKYIMGVDNAGLHPLIDNRNEDQQRLSAYYFDNSDHFPVNKIVEQYMEKGGVLPKILAYAPEDVTDKSGMKNFDEFFNQVNNTMNNDKPKIPIKRCRFLVDYRFGEINSISLKDTVKIKKTQCNEAIYGITNKFILRAFAISPESGIAYVKDKDIGFLLNSNYNSIYMIAKSQNNLDIKDIHGCAQQGIPPEDRRRQISGAKEYYQTSPGLFLIDWEKDIRNCTH